MTFADYQFHIIVCVCVGGMCVWVCVWVCVCVGRCGYVWVCVCMGVCVWVYACLCMQVDACMCIINIDGGIDLLAILKNVCLSSFQQVIFV